MAKNQTQANLDQILTLTEKEHLLVVVEDQILTELEKDHLLAEEEMIHVELVKDLIHSETEMIPVVTQKETIHVEIEKDHLVQKEMILGATEKDQFLAAAETLAHLQDQDLVDLTQIEDLQVIVLVVITVEISSKFR